jgi:hypothetical protein
MNRSAGQSFFCCLKIFSYPKFFAIMKKMDTIEHLSDFLRKIGAPNFLAIGIAIIVLWLLISGLRKGLRKGGQNKGHEDKNEN